MGDDLHDEYGFPIRAAEALHRERVTRRSVRPLKPLTDADVDRLLAANDNREAKDRRLA